MLVTEMSGEVQMNGLLGHEFITDVTDGEFVAVNRRVWRELGTADKIVDKSSSKLPTEEKLMSLLTNTYILYGQRTE